MLGISKFKSGTVTEIKEDQGRITILEGLVITALAGLSLSIGQEFAFPSPSILLSFRQVAVYVLLALLVTGAWAGVVYLIGTKVFKGSTDFAGLAKPVLFSLTPGLLFVLASIGTIRNIVSPIVAAWIVIINVVVLKTVLGFSRQKSMVTVIVSAWIMIILLEILGLTGTP